MGGPNCAESDEVICIDDDDDDDDDVQGGDDGGGDGAAGNEEMDWSQKERQRKGKMPFVSAPAAVPGSIAGASNSGTSQFAADETIVIEEELGEDDDLVVTGCTTTAAPALNGDAQLQGYRFGAASVATDVCPVSDGGSDDDELFVIHPGTSKEDAKQKRARTRERTHVADARAAKRGNRTETGADATVCVTQTTGRSDANGHRAPARRAPDPTRAQCAAAVGGGPGEGRPMPSPTTKTNTAARAAAAAAPKRAGPTPAAAAKEREKALRRDEREEEMRAKGKKCEKEVTLVMESSALEQTNGVGRAIVARMKQMGMLYRVEASNAGYRDHGVPLDSDWIVLRWVWHRPVGQSEPCTAGDAPSAPSGPAEGEVLVPYVMLIIGADSIANMVKGAGGGGRQAFAPTGRADGLERIVHAVRTRFRGSTICILMVGMDTGSVRSRERKEFSQQATARKPTDQGRVAFTMGAFRQQITSLCVRHGTRLPGPTRPFPSRFRSAPNIYASDFFLLLLFAVPLWMTARDVADAHSLVNNKSCALCARSFALPRRFCTLSHRWREDVGRRLCVPREPEPGQGALQAYRDRPHHRERQEGGSKREDAARVGAHAVQHTKSERKAGDGSSGAVPEHIRAHRCAHAAGRRAVRV